MIVSMKKVFLVVQDKDILSAMTVLRQMGLVHIQHEKNPAGQTLNELKEKSQVLTRVIEILSLHKLRQAQVAVDDWQQKAAGILLLVERIQHVKDDLAKRRGLLEVWELWGDFEPKEIEALREEGIHIQFIEYPKGEKISVPEGVFLETVFIKNSVVRSLAVSQKEIRLPFHTLILPPVRLKAVKEQLLHGGQAVQALEDKIKDATKYLNGFKKVLVDIQQELNFQEVYQGRGEQDSFAYLKGFAPLDRCRELEQLAKQERWGLLITEPDDEDQVPTLLRNPRWINMMKPVFRLMNVLPGYKELDVSFVFLLFFSLFYSMLIGDAGYGLVYLLLTFWCHRKFGPRMQDRTIFVLLYFLNGCTIVWGILTGAFFGQTLLAHGKLFPLLPWLNDPTHLQMLCFLIGAIHISIAHIWRVLLKMPHTRALADCGWLLIVWGMFFLANRFILRYPIPAYIKIFFILGAVLVILFSRPSKNFLKTLGGGLGDFLLQVMNTFADVVSYVRLFAVGLATTAIADAFNTMAQGMGFNHILTGLLAGFILIVGHMLNIILSPMAVLVHGLRLNILEFSNHLGMEWTGSRYSPFKIEDDNLKIHQI